MDYRVLVERDTERGRTWGNSGDEAVWAQLLCPQGGDYVWFPFRVIDNCQWCVLALVLWHCYWAGASGSSSRQTWLQWEWTHQTSTLVCLASFSPKRLAPFQLVVADVRLANSQHRKQEILPTIVVNTVKKVALFKENACSTWHWQLQLAG